MTATHADICRDARTRATWRKANEVLDDALRDRLVLDAIASGNGSYEGIQATLQQARADIADGVMSSDGRLTWAF
jgi:hypothetical protein